MDFDIYTLNFMVVACLSVAVFLIWMSFYPTNLNFLMERISTQGNYKATVIQEDKTNQVFKAFLPSAQKLAKRFAKRVPKEQLEKISKDLALAGNPLEMKPVEFYFMPPVGALYGLLGGVLFGIVADIGYEVGILAAILGAYAPQATLKKLIKTRGIECDNQLPDILDLLAVCMESGMTLTKSLEVICAKNKGLLPNELKKVLADTDRGATRVEAFVGLSQRVNSKRMEKIVHAVKISEVLGSPIANQLKELGGTIREETFENVKQKAAKAASMVILPVIVFIVPAVMIIVAGPVGMSMFLDK